jgi:hypothetical protein
MEPTQELIDAIYRERVLRARRMSPEEKLLAGPQLFDYACRIVRDGIRNQNPGVTEEQVEVILLQRLALRQRLEEYECQATTPLLP